MASYFFEGMQIGLVLCFLLGPIFFTLIQTSVEEGFRAGLMVGSGIWVGDMLYISAIYWGLSHIVQITAWEQFTLYLGFVGGIILLVFGLGSLLTANNVTPPDQIGSRQSSIFSLFTKGFLVNAINPFTVFFWIGITTTFTVGDQLMPKEAFWFFSGILFTIIFTDIAKIFLAKSIRKWLKPIHIMWVRRITGILLIVFGIVMFIRIFTYQVPIH